MASSSSSSSSFSSSSNVSTNVSTATTFQLPIPTIPGFNSLLWVALTKDNYLLWKYQVVTHLNAQNVLDYVDGSKLAPPITIANVVTDTIQPILTPNPEYKTWVQYDQVILSMLIASLSKPILAQVLGYSTSRALWLSLECMFTSQSRAREMHTQYKLAIAKKGNQNMTNYFQKMRSLSDNLAAIG